MLKLRAASRSLHSSRRVSQMGDRVGPQIEEELPAEITAPDGDPEDPPAEYMGLL